MKKYFSDLKGHFCVERMVWLESHSLPNTFGRLSFMPASDFPRANVGFSALTAKIRENDPILPEIRLFLAIIFPFSRLNFLF